MLDAAFGGMGRVLGSVADRTGAIGRGVAMVFALLRVGVAHGLCAITHGLAGFPAASFVSCLIACFVSDWSAWARGLSGASSARQIGVAATDRYKDKVSGEMREATEWHRIAFFGRLAEIAGGWA